MKKRKVPGALVFSGILLILSCVVLGKGLVAACSRWNGDYAMQKVVATVKNPGDSRAANAFSVEDLERLKKELATGDISCTARPGAGHTSVSSGSRTMDVRLTGVDHKYPLFGGVALKEGSFITPKQEEEGTLVAVIDDELAWEMFKTDNAVGKTLDLYGAVFRITGIVEKDRSLLGKLTDDGLPDVYIPAAVMLELDGKAGITTLQIKTPDARRLDLNGTAVADALRQLGKVPSNYNISDYNLKLALMEQKPLLLVFILGTVSMLLLAAHAKKLASRLYVLIRDGCRTDYLSNVIRCNLKAVGRDLAEMAAVLLGMALIWKGISFSLYVPPRNIPDQLINISYYSGLMKAAVQSGIQKMGYVPSETELAVNTIDILLNLLFWISLLLGLLLLYAGFREFKALKVDLGSLTATTGLYFGVSMALLAVGAFWAGLPFLPEEKSLLVVWTFIFLNALSNQKGTSP